VSDERSAQDGTTPSPEPGGQKPVEPPTDGPPPAGAAPGARTPPGPPPGGGIDWRRVGRGIFWIGIGTLLLLNTMGQLRWSVWLGALSYWPVLLVGLGLRILFDRSRVPAGVLLSPLLIIGTLAWVAVTGPTGPVGEVTPLGAERTEGATRWILDGNFAMATLDIRSGPLGGGRLVEGEAISTRDPRLRVSDRTDSTRVWVRREDHDWEIMLPSRREHWDLEVADDLPLALDFDMAFTGGEVDLSSTLVQEAKIDGAFNVVTLRLGKPDKRRYVYLEGAFNRYEIVVPEDVPVSVSTDGFLNPTRGRRRARRLDEPGYRVRVEGAFNRIRVRSN
jgi:hypothetical protein